MSFENQISEKLGRHNPHEVIKNIKIKKNLIFIQIEQLILDGFFKAEKFTEDHKNTLEKYTSLIHCSLGNFGLTSLENFPKLLPHLKINQIKEETSLTIEKKEEEIDAVNVEINELAEQIKNEEHKQNEKDKKELDRLNRKKVEDLKSQL